MLKLEYYVPASHLEATQQAIFAAGAGRIGNYDSCCWVTEGRGQFRALDGANPYLGQVGQVEQEPEYKVELVLDEQVRSAVIAALKQSHPYETPAYQLIPVQT
ncbi:NGG1p interacting factor NIF3 [Motiliproteus coralliicola]|uniref:NGG1p interacting factor NIF3 n=1 Tax=Motiliproteus coralliicola TaxID=2283196 RepID=A0A369WRW4_9GAMM|nr:NGG1p interacting factor NIF3 [Motiliproteus coralliicola]RDE24291.1 NGG1p interacting factor NIF3 [Motiliproteus coralliicola]